MKESIKKNLVPASIFAVGIFISLSIFLKFGIDFLQKIFSIIGSFSLGVALLAYLYKKKQDEMLATIGQITFFREKIIPEWHSVTKAIQAKDVTKQYWFSRIEINKSSIEYIKKEFSRNFENQLKIFFDSTQANESLWLDGILLDKQVLLLNLLEEFSLTIKHFKIENHPALSSVRGAFVEIIEKNAAALFFMRDVMTGDSVVYSANLEIYNSWKLFATKPTYIKNLAKYDLISKKQKEDIYDKKRSNSLENVDSRAKG